MKVWQKYIKWWSGSKKSKKIGSEEKNHKEKSLYRTRRTIHEHNKNELEQLKHRLEFIGVEFSEFNFIGLEIPFNVWYDCPPEIGNNCKSICTKIEDGYWEFIMEFGEGGYIKPHYHSDVHEKLFIMEGYIIDKVTNIMVKAGSEYIIDKGNKHYIKAPEGCVLNAFVSKDPF